MGGEPKKRSPDRVVGARWKNKGCLALHGGGGVRFKLGTCMMFIIFFYLKENGKEDGMFQEEDEDFCEGKDLNNSEKTKADRYGRTPEYVSC